MKETLTTDVMRERIFKLTEGNMKQVRAFEKYNKPGISNKLLMWVFAPAYYTPYPIAKLRSRLRKKTSHVPDVSDISSVGGPSEIKLTRFLAKTLKESDVFYDIGANYGFYTLLGLNFCETHSFEPLPDVFASMKTACEKREIKNSQAFPVNVALSDKIGEATIYVNHADFGSSTMIESRTEIDKEAYTALKIQMTTLDEYVKTNHPPTVIKMDVEGFESMVIEGGRNFFKNNSPVIGMEVWGGSYNHISMPAVHKLIELGYNVYKIDLEGDLEQTDEVHLSSLGVTDNFVFRR